MITNIRFVACTDCNGSGETIRAYGPETWNEYAVPCSECEGYGKVFAFVEPVQCDEPCHRPADTTRCDLGGAA